jgi:hypothetical protein
MRFVSNAVILCPSLRGYFVPLGRKWAKCRNIHQRPVRYGNTKCIGGPQESELFLAAETGLDRFRVYRPNE